MDAIRQIASLKSQEYVIRKLLFEKYSISGSKDIVIIKDDETPRIARDNSQNHENYKHEALEVSEVEDDDNWYDRWRKDNL